MARLYQTIKCNDNTDQCMVKHPSFNLTLLGDSDGLGICQEHLMEATSELVSDVQLLLLTNKWVIETWKTTLEIQAEQKKVGALHFLFFFFVKKYSLDEMSGLIES